MRKIVIILIIAAWAIIGIHGFANAGTLQEFKNYLSSGYRNHYPNNPREGAEILSTVNGIISGLEEPKSEYTQGEIKAYKFENTPGSESVTTLKIGKLIVTNFSYSVTMYTCKEIAYAVRLEDKTRTLDVKTSKDTSKEGNCKVTVTYVNN